MIDINNVTYTYNVTDAMGKRVERIALKNFSLNVKEGQVVVLTGGSGCGKSTVLRLIDGLIPHYFAGELHGDVKVNNINVSTNPIYDTAKIVGTVFQNPKNQFFNVDSTSELAFNAENFGRNPDMIINDIDRVSSWMNLNPLLARSMFALSGGEKQKIACASIAVADTPIIVLDEPTSNLDARGIEKLRKVIALWKKQKKTIIIAEHRLYFLKGLADRVLILKDGEIKKEMNGTVFDALSIAETTKLGLRAVNIEEISDKVKAITAKRNLGKRCISIENLEYVYPDGEHGISRKKLDIPTEAIVCIVGDNGKGKSTLAKCLCGLNKKAKGRVIYNTKQLPLRNMLEHCFMVMQDVNYQLFTESVNDEIQLSVDSRIEEVCTNTVNEAMKMLDIENLSKLHPMALSGGQKQRVALACAVASNKEILILDEPTSGLDYYHMIEVARVLKMLTDNNRTVIVITHDIELVNECADYVIEM